MCLHETRDPAAAQKVTLEEYVARALWEKFEEPMGEDAMVWDDANAGEKSEFLDFARAAIKAVEEWHAQERQQIPPGHE